MPTSARNSRPLDPETPPDLLPSLFSGSYASYQARPANFVLAFLLHALAIATLAAVTALLVHTHSATRKMASSDDGIPLIAPFSSDGKGGGGTQDPRPPSRGVLPAVTPQPLTPPEAVAPNLAAMLQVPPSLMGAQVIAPQVGQIGDPLHGIVGAPSNGPGQQGGVGTGCCGGIGGKDGPGYGTGSRDGVQVVGGKVTAPRVLFSPDPDYSDEARKSKVQGRVVLFVVVGADGRPRDLRVVHSLGYGLDEKALEAVQHWKFDPARLDDRPVAVQINVEVVFRLF
jgi:TonB family protein